METLKYKERFARNFESICSNHSKFTVWSDFIHMIAYSISNSCDYKQEREDSYLAIVKRYSKSETEKLSELFALTVLALEENRYQDFLGQVYMDYGFGDTRKGEYFTPYDIAALITKLAQSEQVDEVPYVTVNDPACGSGVMLIAFANEMIKEGATLHQQLFVIANDLDPCIALMCYIQLSLLGCAGYVCIRNTLSEPVEGSVYHPPADAFLTPLFFHPVWQTRRLLKSMRRANNECS